MRKILAAPQTRPITAGYLITALAKLAVRFGKYEEIATALAAISKANNLELQQRAGEMARILARKELADILLVPIEVDEKELKTAPIERNGQTAEIATENKAPENDLLSLDLPVQEPKKNSDDLLDLLSSPVNNEKKVENVEKERVAQGAVEALRTSDYVIYFEINRNQNNCNQIAIRSTVFGLSDMELNNFMVQYGVPVGWVISAKPPSKRVLEPKGGAPITQILMLENRGSLPLMMKTQTSYMYRSQPIKELGQINPIFN